MQPSYQNPSQKLPIFLDPSLLHHLPAVPWVSRALPEGRQKAPAVSHISDIPVRGLLQPGGLCGCCWDVWARLTNMHHHCKLLIWITLGRWSPASPPFDTFSSKLGFYTNINLCMNRDHQDSSLGLFPSPGCFGRTSGFHSCSRTIHCTCSFLRSQYLR